MQFYINIDVAFLKMHWFLSKLIGNREYNFLSCIDGREKFYSTFVTCFSERNLVCMFLRMILQILSSYKILPLYRSLVLSGNIKKQENNNLYATTIIQNSFSDAFTITIYLHSYNTFAITHNIKSTI